MIIHVVQSGETILSIADKYGVSTSKLIQDNGIVNASNLAIGQTILVVYPKQIHIVQEGDTLSSIAENYGITIIQLLRNNPFLLDREFIYPGETLVIHYADDKVMNISTNGYAYPYIDKSILEKSLLFLTYLSIYNYSLTPDGGLNDIDDIALINSAKSYGVAAIMVLSNKTTESTIDMELIHQILVTWELTNHLIEDILNTLKEKGYYGINIDIPYIQSEDRQLYWDFISTLSARLHEEGLKIFLTLTPNSFILEEGLTNENIDYTLLGQITDGVTLLSYNWGYTSQIPLEATPTYLLELFIVNILAYIPPEKITIGISSIGYVWELPYVEGVSVAYSISNTNAVQLASDAGAVINYNQNNLSSYFYISNRNNYFVYFHNVRGFDSSLKLMNKHNLQNVAIWNIMYYQTQEFLLINTQYNINMVT